MCGRRCVYDSSKGDNQCLRFISTGPLYSKVSSTENVRGSSDSLHESPFLKQPPSFLAEPPKPTEDVFVVELRREAPHKLGLSIIGGADNPNLQNIHVRN